MAKSKKATFKDYMETSARIKPSAEVKFASVQDDGSTDEISSRQQYWESMTSDEVQTVNEEFEKAVMEGIKKSPSTGDLLNKIDQISKDRPEPEIKKEIKEVVEKINELNENTTEKLDEFKMEKVKPEEMEIADPDEVGPVAGNFEELEPEDDMRDARPQVSPDVGLILATLEKLIDKIDNMQNFTPVIHVPAPVIHVTLPETTRTVTKAVERDGEGWIKSVRETIEEKPQGEPLIEVKKTPEEPEDIKFEEDE